MTNKKKYQVKVVYHQKREEYVLRWQDKRTSKWKQKATGTKSKKKARTLAIEQQRLVDASTEEMEAISWSEFRARYETEHLTFLSAAYFSSWTTAANHLERLCQLHTLQDVDQRLLLDWQFQLRTEEKSPSSINNFMRHIKAALGWAEYLGLLEKVPKVRPLKAVRKVGSMRSRPVTEDEFEQILEAVPTVRPRDSEAWVYFLKCLHASGLRVSELLKLTWTEEENWSIITSHEYPLIRIFGDGQKNRCDQYQVITPEFWSLLQESPAKSGLVCQLPSKGKQMTVKRCVRNISDIGRAAKVETGPGKMATSHDIGRRSHITRMDGVLSLSENAAFHRHADPRTTSEYYLHTPAMRLAEKLWQN